jgi:DNA-binding MarR family transcriptional regulator
VVASLQEYDKYLTTMHQETTFVLMASVSAEAPTIADIALDLRDAAQRNDCERIGGLLETAIELTETAGVAQLTRCRERVGRLMEALDGVATSAADYALGRLHEADRFLDQRRTYALGVRAQLHRERRAETLRGQVLALLLQSPQRPRDVARELKVDPSQVSRALRELQRDGQIERDATWTQDRRAHVYVHRSASRQPASAR